MSQRVNCPACGLDKAHAVRVKADIVECDSCHVTYLRTRPDVAELENLYQTYHTNPGSHMKLPETVAQILASGLRRDDFLKEVIQHAGPASGTAAQTILDIGCGWGAFLHNCRHHGFVVEGVEICKGMADFGWDVLGIPIQSRQLEQCTFKDGSLHIVTMIHSLEHLPRQRESLDLLHRLVEQDGFICGIVPNFASFCSGLMGDNWPWLDPVMHYAHFTPETLPRFLWDSGFNVHHLHTVTGDFDRNLLAKYVRGAELAMTGDHLNAKVLDIERRGLGEELRFCAQRI